MALVDEKPLYIGNDTTRIDMLAHTYSVYKFPDEPDIIPNPAPHIFPEWGGNCQATKAGLYNEPSPFQIANPTNVLTVDAHERRRYHVARSSSRNIPELCREFLAVSSIFEMAEVWTSCSAAVSFFIGKTISGNIRFKESLHRRRERVRVTSLPLHRLSVASMLSGSSLRGGSTTSSAALMPKWLVLLLPQSLPSDWPHLAPTVLLPTTMLKY